MVSNRGERAGHASLALCMRTGPFVISPSFRPAARSAERVASGAKGTDAEIEAVIDYVATHFPAETVARINVNKARAIELEAGLSLKRSEAAAVIAYRTKNGPFKSLQDLKSVPGID